MSESAAVADSRETAKAPSMGTFERFLTLWVALCIIVGIGLGQAMPGVFHGLGAATVAQVNLPVAVLVWLMIVPMLLKIDPAALGQVGNHWRGIAATVGVNWLVKPFSMALLGWLFIAHLFRPFLPADQIDGYIAGLILLAAAPCSYTQPAAVASENDRAAVRRNGFARPARLRSCFIRGDLSCLLRRPIPQATERSIQSCPATSSGFGETSQCDMVVVRSRPHRRLSRLSRSSATYLQTLRFELVIVHRKAL